MIFIDGVVGVGKSTLGEILSKEFKVPLYKKPVYDNPLLDKFYCDKKKYSFPLQVFFLNKRLQMVEKARELEEYLIVLYIVMLFLLIF